MKTNGSDLTRNSRLLLTLLALLTIATSLYVRIRLLGTPLERDEGEYAYMAQLLLKGIPPFTHAYTMKLPGVALVYALFMGIFGQNTTGIHIGLTLVNAACIGLVYLLGKNLFTRDTAITAAAFYALLSLSQSVLGVFAHATHLVVLFSLTGIILLMRAFEKQHNALIPLGGICFGMALLMKQHAAIMFLFAVLFQIWLQRNGNRKLLFRNIFILLASAATPYLIVALWLLAAGVFDRFWFWTVSYASAYATGLSISAGIKGFIEQFSSIIKPNIIIWMLAFTGIFATFKQDRSSANKRFLLSYLLVSFIMVCPGLYFRRHYFILMLPAIALAAGYAAQAAQRLFTNRLAPFLPALLLAIAAACYITAENDYLFKLSPVEVSRRIYGANPFADALQIAQYLRANSTENDRIAILGSEPEMLFYADRLSATGHIYMYGLMENHRYAEKMQRQLISEIESTAPLYIVIVHSSASWLLKPDSINRVLDWGDSYIPLRYDEVGIVDIFGDKPARFLWGEATARYEPESDSFVSIFRRRW